MKLTTEELADLLVRHGIIPCDAVDDPEGYDASGTMSAVFRLRVALNDLAQEPLRQAHHERQAAVKLLQWFMRQCQGDSGTGESHWGQFEEYRIARMMVMRLESEVGK